MSDLVGGHARTAGLVFMWVMHKRLIRSRDSGSSAVLEVATLICSILQAPSKRLGTQVYWLLLAVVVGRRGWTSTSWHHRHDCGTARCDRAVALQRRESAPDDECFLGGVELSDLKT